MPSLTPLARLRERRYSPDQPRDSNGEWSSGGGDSGSGGAKSEEESKQDVYSAESAAGASLGRGQTFNTPEDADNYANKILQDNGSHLGPAEVEFTDTPNESGSYMSHDGATHPVIQLGKGMRDQLTVAHEVSHSLTRESTANFDNPKGDTGHGEAFQQTFHNVLKQEMPAHAAAIFPNRRSLTPLARLRARRYSDSQPRDDHGRWTSSGGGDDEAIGGGGGGGSIAALPTSVQPITASELAGTGPGATSGPGASRPVSQEEFNQLASQGQARLDTLSASSPPAGLDQNFDSIKSDAYQQVQQSWGGATYDAHTGEAITGTENKYALTTGGSQNTVTLPENASQADFNSAMDQARSQFGDELSKSQRSLGVFHNDDAGTIEIDPVLVVNNLSDVESIGAATHAIGGAYNFADGNGYWPPHVAETAAKAA